jgi:ParB/RepB/Spo0J family partition protein
MSPKFKDLALDTLYLSPYNVRKDPGDLDELIASIKDNGVLEPILLRQRGEEYEVIAGRRRMEAARIAGLQTIPATVLEVTDLQAIIVSLIENVQRKDLTLAERVQTYQTLQQLAPEYQSLHSLAKVVDLSHQKISQDFQAYAVLRKLQPHGFTLASHLPPSAVERQQGTALPEYHAVLVHQAMSYLLEEAGVVTEGDADKKMIELAKLIAPLSQDAAKELIDQVKAGEQPARFITHAPFRQFNATWHNASRSKKSSPKRRESGGLVTCSCCNRILQLVHQAAGTHAIVDTPLTGQSLLPAPTFPAEPTAAALNPAPTTSDEAPVLAASGTPPPILKRTACYTINAFPKGLNSVLNLQTTGFWGKLSQSAANPDFTEADIPQSIWTADPWIGCLWGTSCQFCYVPSLATRVYPNGRQSYWYQQWGSCLLYKPDFPNRLRKHLLDGAGQTGPLYQGAAIYMSPKTDPLVSVPDALAITARNLDVFLDAVIFLMIQTRSKAVEEEHEPDIFNRIVELARRKKVGVSFSISTDLLDQQRRIERGGLTPEERLRIMARLKHAGVFVSAAVAPLMPASPDFARKLVECCHHASIQVLHLTGSGAATPRALLNQTQREIPHYRELDRKLTDEIEAVNGAAGFSWGMNNKGFIGAFLAARRFYEKVSVR